MAQTYVVTRGDTLRKIAKSQLGDGALFARIAELNGLRDPGSIAVGQRLYWKVSIADGMPPDFMHYRRTMKDFPHQSTADPFFDESQFESHRNLGYEVARRSIEAMKKNGGCQRRWRNLGKGGHRSP